MPFSSDTCYFNISSYFSFHPSFFFPIVYLFPPTHSIVLVPLNFLNRNPPSTPTSILSTYLPSPTNIFAPSSFSFLCPLFLQYLNSLLFISSSLHSVFSFVPCILSNLCSFPHLFFPPLFNISLHFSPSVLSSNSFPPPPSCIFHLNLFFSSPFRSFLLITRSLPSCSLLRLC